MTRLTRLLAVSALFALAVFAGEAGEVKPTLSVEEALLTTGPVTRAAGTAAAPTAKTVAARAARKDFRTRIRVLFLSKIVILFIFVRM